MQVNVMCTCKTSKGSYKSHQTILMKFPFGLQPKSCYYPKLTSRWCCKHKNSYQILCLKEFLNLSTMKLKWVNFFASKGAFLGGLLLLFSLQRSLLSNVQPLKNLFNKLVHIWKVHFLKTTPHFESSFQDNKIQSKFWLKNI